MSPSSIIVRTVQDIIDTVADDFDVSPETAATDVLTFVQDLQSKGLLELSMG